MRVPNWWPWRARWVGVIVGGESGRAYPLAFVTFRQWREADAWAQRMNRHGRRTTLTYFDVRPIEPGNEAP